ncbi:hypothetical protein SAZ11_29470 [Streptomyces sp. FXJ1.4098]|uniref:hypothetical protein n=1 Tax=Streptomyces sp. NPDC020845 TaxID=3365096 RepID=UPI0029922F01|nr:hypothetical protein [Streptomyces sp. FXJ1.4098]
MGTDRVALRARRLRPLVSYDSLLTVQAEPTRGVLPDSTSSPQPSSGSVQADARRSVTWAGRPFCAHPARTEEGPNAPSGRDLAEIVWCLPSLQVTAGK